MATMNMLSEHAKEMLGMPPDWEAYQFEAIGGTFDQPAKLLKVTGAVAPAKTRGKYKGRPNWKKLDKATEKTVFITPAEHAEWLRQWEAKTGICANCTGTGQVMKRWTAANGVERMPCSDCGGTGLSPNA